MKKILGLDIGTNSIGWAVVTGESESDGQVRLSGIEAAGSRIIPMDAAKLGDFEKGNNVSQTANRTMLRGSRRLRERFSLRRERLLRVLDRMGFLPAHYSNSLDRYGHFKAGEEPKLAWRLNEEGVSEFLFEDAFHEMLADFRRNSPEQVGEGKKVPYDWTLYYLRKRL